MSSLTNEQLSNWREEISKNPKTQVAINAVTRNPMKNVILNREVGNVNHVFSHKIKKEGKPVTNQRSSGRCWIFAFLNHLRLDFSEKFDISDDFEFSQTYLFFYDKLEKSNYFLNSIIETRDLDRDSRVVNWLLTELVSDGGQFHMLVNLIRKYGVVPKEIYPDAEASTSSRDMNKLLKFKLRHYAQKLRDAYEKEKLSLEQLVKKKEEYVKDIHRMLCIFLGKPPTNFSWACYNSKKEYVGFENITPLDFFNKEVPFNLDDHICLIHAPTADKPYNRLFTVEHLGNVAGGDIIKYVNVEMDLLKKATCDQIKDGASVWFGCDVGAYGFHRDEGILDTKLFDIENTFDFDMDMNKAQRLNYGNSLMTHAMLFTAVDVKNDKTTKWRVENSWGDKSGHKGYLIMKDNWFDEYVYEAVINKKYVSKEVVDILEQDPIVLKPWDPFGSLATV